MDRLKFLAETPVLPEEEIQGGLFTKFQAVTVALFTAAAIGTGLYGLYGTKPFSENDRVLRPVTDSLADKSREALLLAAIFAQENFRSAPGNEGVASSTGSSAGSGIMREATALPPTP